jgi:hypothetical protein
MSHLVDSLERAYRVLGLEDAASGDEVFRHLVLARIIEPSSKLDSLRVLEEAGVAAGSYRTLKRRLPVYAQEAWRQGLSEACAAHARLGPASLVLYDVSTLYFEADRGDGFREPGFSKERRLEPQITIGLLTGRDGFPLMVSAFEGNRAETKTMLPVIEAFMAAHQLPDVTVVADAGMISEANQKAIEAAGLSFILGMKIPDVPYQVAQWRREHPGEDIPDGHIFTQPWPAGPTSKRRDQMIYYQYRADRARRALRGIDEQVAKAAKAVAGLAPVKRNRFIALDGAAKRVNRDLTWLKLVRIRMAVDAVEGFAEVGGQGVGGGDGVLTGLDADGAVAAGGSDELADGPAGLGFDPAADRQGGEHDGQVGLYRVPLVVVDRAGLQVVLGHAE